MNTRMIEHVLSTPMWVKMSKYYHDEFVQQGRKYWGTYHDFEIKMIKKDYRATVKDEWARGTVIRFDNERGYVNFLLKFS